MTQVRDVSQVEKYEHNEYHEAVKKSRGIAGRVLYKKDSHEYMGNYESCFVYHEALSCEEDALIAFWKKLVRKVFWTTGNVPLQYESADPQDGGSYFGHYLLL